MDSSKRKLEGADLRYVALNMDDESIFKRARTNRGLTSNVVPPKEVFLVKGMRSIVDTIMRDIRLPLRYPGLFFDNSIGAAKGVMIYGKPGVGKTTLANAIRVECDQENPPIAFLFLTGSTLLQGNPIKNLEDLVTSAKNQSPCAVVVDEMDELIRQRRDASTSAPMEILDKLDGFFSKGNSGIYWIFCTNDLEFVESALMRPGRLHTKIEVPLPTAEECLEYLKHGLRKQTVHEDVNLDAAAHNVTGLTPAAINAICDRAKLNAVVRKNAKLTGKAENWDPTIESKIEITHNDLNEAIGAFNPPTTLPAV